MANLRVPVWSSLLPALLCTSLALAAERNLVDQAETPAPGKRPSVEQLQSEPVIEGAEDPGARLSSAVFDPRSYQKQVVGELTQVLVLGVAHLSSTPDNFDPAVLEPLLERLEAFAPDLIAIENLSGESLHALQAYEGIYPGVVDLFGSRFLALSEQARRHAGIDSLPAAELKLRQALADLPAEPSPSQRRHLALLFLAAADPNSALVQWWRLPEDERKAAEELPESLVEDLQRFGKARNESRQIAARLAARRGLERVHPMDDHSAVDSVFPILDTLASALQDDPTITERLEHPDFVRLSTAQDRMTTPEQALATFRELNRPEAGRLDADSQWLIMLDRAMPASAGRVRMAEWETRNLRMAAHIREASAAVPGGRILVVVGSAHKPWLDAYLGMMSDLRVVDALSVLR